MILRVREVLRTDLLSQHGEAMREAAQRDSGLEAARVTMYLHAYAYPGCREEGRKN